MATWIVHLRIADYFLNEFKNIDSSEFIAGSVAPDCGYGTKDSAGEFDPPPMVTHWTPTGNKLDCRYKDFCECYLKNRENSNESYSFYLGYYIHLLTDIMWSSKVYRPTCLKYADECANDPQFIHEIKADWNDLDCKYLQEHTDFKPIQLLNDKHYVCDYLPYYEHNQLTKQIRYIVDYYKDNVGKTNLDREYIYLSENDINNFVSCAVELLKLDLLKKKLI